MVWDHMDSMNQPVWNKMIKPVADSACEHKLICRYWDNDKQSKIKVKISKAEEISIHPNHKGVIILPLMRMFQKSSSTLVKQQGNAVKAMTRFNTVKNGFHRKKGKKIPDTQQREIPGNQLTVILIFNILAQTFASFNQPFSSTIKSLFKMTSAVSLAHYCCINRASPMICHFHRRGIIDPIPYSRHNVHPICKMIRAFIRREFGATATSTAWANSVIVNIRTQQDLINV